MSTRSLHPLVQQFFRSLERSEEEFLESLSNLLREVKQSSVSKEEPAPARFIEPPFLPQIDLSVADRRSPWEERASYNAHTSQRDESQGDELDTAPHTVGEALQQFLGSNRMSPEEAARRLGITTEQMQQIADGMMPLTSKTVPGVARFFAREFGLPQAELTLRQWLITGLRELEMKDTEHNPTRIAARKKL